MFNNDAKQTAIELPEELLLTDVAFNEFVLGERLIFCETYSRASSYK
tara:strand:- start:129 stop:269 length:141 start_codon:yes stop_codon:yes gene_type:complete